MASKKSEPDVVAPEESRNKGEVSQAADGGTSNRSAGYADNPDKPDESSIAQVEELKDVGE